MAFDHVQILHDFLKLKAGCVKRLGALLESLFYIANIA